MNIALPLSESKTQFFINQTYVNYLQSVGFTPVLIPQGAEKIDLYVAACDGLLLPGGIDIDPIFYGECNVGSRDTEVDKDNFERTLLHKFVEAKKPVFGICRGFQLIVRELLYEFPKVGAHGLLYEQHVSTAHNCPGSLGASRAVAHHDIMVNSQALWKEGKEGMFERRFVNSMHHQGVTIAKKSLIQAEPNTKIKRISTYAGPLEILAYTAHGAEKDDYIIEAFSANWNEARILAVQWHPEELKDKKLLSTFFNPATTTDNTKTTTAGV